MTKTILFISETDSMIELLQFYLSQLGYIFLTSNDYINVVDEALKYCPDIIMIDVDFPNLFEERGCKDLMRDEGTCDIPLLVLSTHPTILQIFERCEATDFLPKPFNLNDLKVKIENLFSALV